MGISPGIPNIRITSTKESDATPFIECRDASGVVKFAVTSDGHITSSYQHSDELSKLPDTIAHSYVASARSVYIGNARISWHLGRFHFSHLQQIPSYLVNTFGTTQSNLVRPAADYTVRQWLAFARDAASLPTLKTSVLFPALYDSDWVEAGVSYAHDLIGPAQGQINALDSDIQTLGLNLQSAESSLGSSISTINGTITNLQSSVSGNTSDIASETATRVAVISALDSEVQDVSGDVAVNTAAIAALGGGSSLELVSTTGDAFLKVESNTDVSGAKSTIELRAESATATLDRFYRIETDPSQGDDLIITCETAANGVLEGWRFNPGGHVAFACGLAPITNLNAYQFQCKGTAYFRDTFRVLKASTFLDNVDIGTVAVPKVLKVNGVAVEQPVSVLHSSSSAPSAGGNVVALAAARDTRIVCGGLGGDSGTQSHRFTLPTSGYAAGDKITVTNRANAVYISINNSASNQFISDGSTRTSATNKSILIQKYSTPPDFFTCITAMESLAADNVTIETTWVTSHGVIY
jgi:hypothetical protein